MNTTLQTSLPLPVLCIGAVLSVVLFVFLFRREMAQCSRRLRWTLITLRTMLCLLVWILIAQPRRVTTHEQSIPMTTRLGVDVSASMSLTDTPAGTHTARWQEGARATLLDEAIALSEAAKIRINLLARRFKVDANERRVDVQKSRDVLAQAVKKIRELQAASDTTRLLNPALEALNQAGAELKKGTDPDAMAALERAGNHAGQAAANLRRVATVIPRESTAQADARPRIELVNRWISEAAPVFDRLADTGRFEAQVFADSLAPAAWGTPFVAGNDLGEGTDLYGNLVRLVTEERGAGRQMTLLITDGMDSSSPKHQVMPARVQDHPLLVLPVGDPSTAPDIRIESVVSPARVREKDTYMARVEVSSRHTGPGRVTVSLKDNGQILASRDLQLDEENRPKIIELEWQAGEPGKKDLWIEVSTVEGEELHANNVHNAPCEVIKDKYRVMVCDGKPRWETRYLQNLFKRDPSIETVSVVFEPRHAYPGKPLPPPVALPLALEQWQPFDLVILGDVSPNQLTPDHQALLEEYVDGGGNLLILAGTDAMPAAYADTPIEKMLPMLQAQPQTIGGTFVVMPPEDRKPDPLVRLGAGNGASVWKALFSITPQHRISAWSKAKESARRLLVARDSQSDTTHDFMALQRYGRGRVVFAAAPCLYHLRTTYGDRYHARFWGQMIRGVCVDNFGFEGGLVKTRLDRGLWGAGAEVQGRVRLTSSDGLPLPNAEFSAVLVKDEGAVARMRPVPDPDRPGDYFLRFPDLAAGEYVVEYAGDDLEPLLVNEQEDPQDRSRRTFTVLAESFAAETLHASDPAAFWSQVDRMPLAATVSPQTLGLVIDALDLEPERITQTSSRSLWDRWWFLLAVVTVAGGEWLLRRMNGLC